MSFTEFADYACYADLRVGANSASAGVPGLDVGASPANEAAGRYMWDANASDGFDSGWVQVSLTVNAGGGAGGVVLTVGSGATAVNVAYSGASYGEVFGFALRAGVDGAGGGTTSFRNIVGKFFYSAAATTPGESDEMDGIVATTAGTAAADDESIVEVYPDHSGFYKAVFSTEIRLQSAELPDPNELFGQLFVYAAPA